jgi:dienelactone hydrolase
MRALHVFALTTGVLFVLALARLVQLDSSPPHEFVSLPGHEPATLYLPGTGNPFFTIFPPANPPPAVVLVHGFSGDRQVMSTLARCIAQNGYAVLAIDVSGHGENRNPFRSGFADEGSLRPDVTNAVDFLRTYQRVDGSRIVAIGHSMGAAAVLDYATTDPALSGAVMISGWFRLSRGKRPKNTLFVFAENDPKFIKFAASTISAHFAGVPEVELGKIYGDFARGTAIEVVQVPGVDHVRIIHSADAARAIMKWLDGTFGTTRSSLTDLTDNRRDAALLSLVLFLVLLVPFGKMMGELAGNWSVYPAGIGGWIGLLILAAALLAAMPLIAIASPAAFFPLVVGAVQVSWFMAAGVIVVIVLLPSPVLEWSKLRDSWGATLLAAAVAMAVIYLGQVALSAPFHRLALSLERLLSAVIGTVVMLPFWFSFELMLRRGGLAVATARAVLGRILIIGVMIAGVFLQVLPVVLMLGLPAIVLIYVMIEIFAASAYSSSNNLALIALVESAWLAWLIAATNPITFVF